MADATIAQGTELRILGPASPAAYIKINGIQSLSPTKTNTMTPIHDLSSDHEEDIATMQGGTLSLTINVVLDDAGHEELEDAANDGLVRTFRYVYTQESPDVVYQFTAIISSEADTPNLAGVVQRAYELKLQSRPTVQ